MLLFTIFLIFFQVNLPDEILIMPEKVCKFSPKIRKVKIASNKPFMITSIKGQNILEIDISGKNKYIPSLCHFLETDVNLPNLEELKMHDLEIKDFSGQQDCGNNDLNKPLKPTKSNHVEVK